MMHHRRLVIELSLDFYHPSNSLAKVQVLILDQKVES